MTRDQKKKVKRRRLDDFHRRRWERITMALNAVGFGDTFRGLGGRGKQWLATVRLPPPEVIFDPSFGQCSAADRVLVDDTLAKMTVPVNGVRVPWIDVYTTLLPLARLYPDGLIDSRHPSAEGTPPDPATSHLLLAESERVLRSTLGEALGELTAGCTQLDRKIYWYRHEPVHGGRVKITLGAEPAERIDAAIGGRRRPAYRCGGIWGAGGFRWVEWPSDALGGSARPEAVPVYIQQHALDRLRERMPVHPRYRNGSLVASLANPVVTRRDGDTVLVQFRLHDTFHLGHLVARRIPGAAVVTTFLLVTMQGTPEADRLYRELKLRRPDIEYTRLDRLLTFVNSDLPEDAELARVFEACGCGDLLHLRAEDRPDLRPRLAPTLREYLGRPANRAAR